MYKMFKVTAETYVHKIKVNKAVDKSVLWIKVIDMQKELDVRNIHDLVDKEIKFKFKINNPTNKQIKKYKKRGSELIDGKIFVYAHKGIIITVKKHCRTPKLCKF